MHGQHLDQFRYIFKTIVGQLWDNFNTTFGSLWNNFVTTLKLLWDNFKTTLRQLRDNFETTLGQLGDNSERTLIQDWDHIGTTQWLLAERTSALWVGSIWPFFYKSFSFSRKMKHLLVQHFLCTKSEDKTEFPNQRRRQNKCNRFSFSEPVWKKSILDDVKNWMS